MSEEKKENTESAEKTETTESAEENKTAESEALADEAESGSDEAKQQVRHELHPRKAAAGPSAGEPTL